MIAEWFGRLVVWALAARQGKVKAGMVEVTGDPESAAFFQKLSDEQIYDFVLSALVSLSKGNEPEDVMRVLDVIWLKTENVERFLSKTKTLPVHQVRLAIEYFQQVHPVKENPNFPFVRKDSENEATS